MQNLQNAVIQQRVINLVELYRTKAGKESQMAKDAKADNDYWEQESVDLMKEEGLSFGGGMYGEGPPTGFGTVFTQRQQVIRRWPICG